MSETGRGSIRKHLLVDRNGPGLRLKGEIHLRTAAIIGYSSESSDHPIDDLLDGSSGPDANSWRSERPDTTERIVVEFDKVQPISRIIYEVVEKERARTQEVRISISEDGGQTYRQLMVQEYTFSPNGATFQREDLRFDLKQVSHLQITIIPNKNGAGRASLSSLRLFN